MLIACGLACGFTTPIVIARPSAVFAAATSSACSSRLPVTASGTRAEFAAIEQQGQGGRVEERGRLRGLDAADDVHRLGVVGHVDDVAVAEILVQAGGDAEGVGRLYWQPSSPYT